MSTPTTAAPASPPPERVNPMVPTSVGALLAEEWTVNHLSTLPSFLEMTMMTEARHSLWKALKAVLSKLQGNLEGIGQPPALEGGERLSLLARLLNVLGVRAVARYIAGNILSKYNPEIRFLIMFWLERKALLSGAAASLTEALYRGRRVKLGDAVGDNQRKLSPMTSRDGVNLALLIALGHYLEERSAWVNNNLRNPNFDAIPLRLKKLFNFLYPLMYTSMKGLSLMQRLKFLLGQSVFYDPHSQLLSLVVRRVTAEDTPPAKTEPPSSTSTTPSPAKPSILGSGREYLDSDMGKKLSIGLVTTAIGLSWIARLQSVRKDIRRQRLLKDPNNTPPPPQPLPEKAPMLRNCPPTHCPLCRQPRVNPTVSTGGYVFCLACLTSFVRATPVCPITGKDCPESSLVRLFEPQTTA